MNNKSILIVEDDLGVLEIYKIGLKIEGYKGKFASSKEQAEKYLNENFDYAILDGLEGDCFELYNKVKAQKKFIVSGDQSILDKCEEKGLKYFLKPISLSEILK